MRGIDIIRSFDWVALAALGLLITLGLAMLVSATYTEGLISALLIRQTVSAAVGIILLILFSFVHYRTLQRYAWVIYGAGVLGLVTVTIFGALVRGTVSRLQIFGVQIQPSEFMKIGLIIALAWVSSRLSRRHGKNILLTAAVAALPVGLILLEPEVGVASLMLAVWFGLWLFLGLPWRWVTILLLLGGLVSVGAWQWGLADYQKDRLRTFLDPARDPLGSGYNITQSIVALGSGGLFGRGLGHGPQSQLKFLPERHTDFILASIGEELGFMGIVLVLGLYTVLLWRILTVVRSSEDRFACLFGVGVFIMLLVSLIVSAGMNMGLLPITGIPLPLVSFGGSNLVTTCVLLGILQSIRAHGKWTATRPIEISYF